METGYSDYSDKDVINNGIFLHYLEGLFEGKMNTDKSMLLMGRIFGSGRKMHFESYVEAEMNPRITWEDDFLYFCVTIMRNRLIGSSG
ncbi:unnamed protein product [Cercopithifilaria johnstoni]|uniref:Uncharacterized protein n=1 Tax=Cercopithifilaria johnstoni TaxID=2874296 RepID=A0A8J2PZ14_9BILA|nr:unnamed protein product [Cercopithifilaria johnstoni]